MSPKPQVLHWPHAARLRTIALVLALGCGAAIAQQPKAGEGPPAGQGGPPAEALAACKTLKSGDACQFTADKGAASGTCEAPQGRPLACRPANAPQAGANAPKK